MITRKKIALGSALALVATPAMAASSITDPIKDPASQWKGIDYWGVQVSQFSTVNQLLTFTIPFDSTVDVYIQGSPKFAFTDILLNGTSIASDLKVNGALKLKASGTAQAGTAALLFKADYTCKTCWGDWFGGYVQVTKAAIQVPPRPPQAAVPEPGTWATMIAGMGIVGGLMRRRRAKLAVA